MTDRSAARRYARAIFSAALAKNELRACQQGLEEVMRISAARRRLGEVLSHPFIGLQEKRAMLRSAMGEFATPLLDRFLSMLVQRSRFVLLPAIGVEFQDCVDRHQGIEPLKIRSAFALSDSQKKEMEKRLAAWRGAKVRLEIQLDPSLIGGLVIQTRDHVLDRSLKGQMEKLQKQLSV